MNNNFLGVIFLVLGMLIFSLQDIAVKWIGGHYSVLEIVALRSLTALPLTVLLFRLEGGHGMPKTKRHRLQYLRGFCYFVSYTTYFMGLAALPLANIAAIKFSGPLMITILSVLLLGEYVGLQRWVALIVGFLGVLLIVQPGSTNFNLGSVFILISVLLYALAIIFTRKLQRSDSSATMAYYSSLVYLIATAILTPIVMTIGDFPNADPSIEFLFRSWAMPSILDAIIMLALGLTWAGGMYCIARAYSTASASIVAPFEYLALPISAMWGFLIWHEIPTLTTWAGAGLTLLSGMYILYQERRQRNTLSSREAAK